MKVIILGAGGMLGHKLVQRFSKEFETTGTVRKLLTDPVAQYCFAKAKIIDDVDAVDIHKIIKILDDVKPDVVINCIGIIKQVKESKDPLVTLKTNAMLPQHLAKVCGERHIRLIHFSTDCIFSGIRGNYTINDIADCEDLYGISKFLGEVAGPGCLTIRTSIIGRELHRGASLIDWFISQKGNQVKGYANAHYTGLTTNAMADLVANLVVNFPKLQGVWQVSADPITKYDLLQIVNSIYDLGIRIEKYEDFKCDRRLLSDEFRAATHFKPLPWEEMIRRMHADPTPYNGLNV